MSLVKYNNNSISAVTSAASIPSGAMTHIKSLTASSSATLSFVHGSSDVVLDSTYPIYVFKFINLHPSASAYLTFQSSIDTGSNYNVSCTSTSFQAAHDEADSTTDLSYNTSRDAANSTSFIPLAVDGGHTGNDDSLSGYLFLFNPSSTTFVKHFIYNDSHTGGASTYAFSPFIAGYFNDTNDVDAIQFKMSSGNIDAGTIKLYGIKDS